MNCNLFDEQPLASDMDISNFVQVDLRDLVLKLMATLESDAFAGEFYVAANTTDWLHHWLSNRPAIQALEEILWEKQELSDIIRCRALEIFKSPTQPKYKIENEAALCCYAFILAGIPEAEARQTVIEMAQNAGPAHGWLKRLLNRCLRYMAISQRVSETHLPATMNIVSATSATDFNSQDKTFIQNATPFESLTEYWTLEQAA